MACILALVVLLVGCAAPQSHRAPPSSSAAEPTLGEPIVIRPSSEVTTTAPASASSTTGTPSTSAASASSPAPSTVIAPHGSGQNATLPVISNVQLKDATTHAADVRWNVQVNAGSVTSWVEFGKYPDGLDRTTQKRVGVGNQTAALENLDEATYYYRVVAQGDAGIVRSYTGAFSPAYS